MIRVGILGDIGSGKSYVAKQFGFPVFNADVEVAKLYKRDKKIFNKFKKTLPKYFNKFPIKKEEVLKAILGNNKNLKKIVKIVHFEIRKKMEIFLKKNNNKKIIILDIPLLLENNINKKRDILVYVHSQKSNILKRLKKRPNYNKRVIRRFRNIQLPLDYKKKKSQFMIKNNFTNKYVKIQIKGILKEIL
tara:strand:- start:213 stop:782 length:570 start_codon:yes stop_codon:yes gene_type:complete